MQLRKCQSTPATGLPSFTGKRRQAQIKSAQAAQQAPSDAALDTDPAYMAPSGE